MNQKMHRGIVSAHGKIGPIRVRSQDAMVNAGLTGMLAMAHVKFTWVFEPPFSMLQVSWWRVGVLVSVFGAHASL